MPYLDQMLTFSDAQSSTVSAATSDYVDIGAQDSKITGAFPGQQYAGCFFVFRMNTAATSSGTTTCTFQVQSSNETSFGDSVTIAASSAFVASQLTAGKMWATRLPATGMRRYLRGYKVMSANTGANYWTAFVLDAYVVYDLDVEINKRYML